MQEIGVLAIQDEGEMEVIMGAILGGHDPGAVLDTYRQAKTNGLGFKSDAAEGHQDLVVTSFIKDGATIFTLGPVEYPEHATALSLRTAKEVRDHLSKLIVQAETAAEIERQRSATTYRG